MSSVVLPVVLARFRYVRRGDSSTAGEAGYPANTSTPSMAAMAREKAEAVARALERLPEDYRRVITLRNQAIMTSFLAESSALAFVAGIIGVILALPVNGLSTKFNGGAVSAPTLAFNFHVTPVIATLGLVFAVVIGAMGGWLPAQQAMRVSVVKALRRN